MIGYFEDRGWKVFSAHKREQWGQNFLRPEEFTRLDFEEISQCEVIIAEPGFPPSAGTHIELGWGTALGKPLVLLLKRGVSYSGMVDGLAAVFVVEAVEVDGSVPLPALENAVERVIARAEREGESRRGRIWLSLSGPSGVGKTTVMNHVARLLPNLVPVRLVTTRPPRGDEEDARQFRFVSRDEWLVLEQTGDLEVSAATYGDELYGVERSALAEVDASRLGVLDLGLENLNQFRSRHRTVSVLLLPPSLAENQRRLKARGSEGREALRRRVRSSVDLLERASEFDYVLVNQDAATTAQRIAEIAHWEIARDAANLSSLELAKHQARLAWGLEPDADTGDELDL